MAVKRQRGTTARPMGRKPTKQDDEATRQRAIYGELEDDGIGFCHRLRHAMNQRQARDGTVLLATMLSVEVKLNKQGVSRYLTGRKRPDWPMSYRLSQRLHCGAGWLVFGGQHGRPIGPGDPTP